jgi:class 3 adenylate cyclase
LTFGLHMGYTIEGAIGSDFKIDACYLSNNVQIAYRVEHLCESYDMQILLTEPLYTLMSLKARSTLRKIDVVTMKECKDPMGIYTFDLSFSNEDRSTVPEDHQLGDLIKLSQY